MLNKLLLGLTLFLSVQLWGQDKDPFADNSETTEVELTMESVAKELKVSWPIQDPVKSLEQIKQEIEKTIATKLLEHFPEKSLDAFKAEENKKYPTYKIGDEVSLTYKFRNTTKEANGAYQSLSKTSLTVGRTPVPIVDIQLTDLISYDPVKRKEYIHKAANSKFYNYNTERTILEEKLVGIYKTTPYKKAGYILEDGQWTKPSIIVKQLFDVKMAALQKKKDIAEKKRLAEEKKFKLIHKSNEGEIQKILGQDPKHVYIGAGILVALILGGAILKR